MSHPISAAPPSHRGTSLRAIGLAAAVLSAATAFAVESFAGDTAASSYARERAACLDGSSQQDRATCLKEAGAARDEARRGHLGPSTKADNTQINATARCNALPAKDKDDCIARVHGAGTTSGSVKEGGIYRELVTTTPAPSSSSSPSTVSKP